MGEVQQWVPWVAAGVIAAGVGLAAPAGADVNGYIAALDGAELIDRDDDPYHCLADGVCFGQFDTASAALQTGDWVCEQIRMAGKPPELVVDWLSHGEGLMPSSYTAPIIVEAATSQLCPG